MGLDQELRRFTRLDEEQAEAVKSCKTYEELDDLAPQIGVVLYEQDTFDDNSDIYPYFTIVTLPRTCIEYDKMSKKLGIPTDSRPCAFTG